MLPWPAWLSSHSRPPISFTSWEQIARPSPVPPYFRVIERSACSKASKITCCFSGGMPIPVSETAKRELRLVLAASLGLHMKHNFSLLGELDGVANEVEDDLAQPGRISHQRIGHIGPDVAGEFESLLLSPQRQQLQGIFESVSQIEFDGIEVQFRASILEKSRMSLTSVNSELAEFLHSGEISSLFGCESRIQSQLRHADDAVQRCANLVTHVRQEFASGLGRFFSPAPGCIEFPDKLRQSRGVFFLRLSGLFQSNGILPQPLFGLLALGDVARIGIDQLLPGKRYRIPQEPSVRAVFAKIPILE